MAYIFLTIDDKEKVFLDKEAKKKGYKTTQYILETLREFHSKVKPVRRMYGSELRRGNGERGR